jgi:zinc protease
MDQIKYFEEASYGTKVVLKNGLTVLVSESHVAPVVDILTYVQAGRMDEPVDAPGVALVVGSMLYRGTLARKEGATARDTHLLGGSLRRSINIDHALFETTVPAGQWKKALEIQADALLNASFEKDVLPGEIEAIVRREKIAQDDTGDLARSRLLALGFHQPFVMRASEEQLRRITREQAWDFYRSRYIASGIILTVCGDVSPAEVLNAVVDFYAKLADVRKGVPASAIEDRSAGFRYGTVRGSVQLPRVLVGFHTARADHPDFPATELMRAILAQGEGSLLARRTRDHDRIILGQDAETFMSRRLGYFIVRMDMDEKQIDRSEIAALTEIEIIKRDLLDRAEIERGKAQLEAEFWSRMQTVEDRARMLAGFEALGDWKKMDGYIARLRQVKPDDVSRVARKYFTLDNCALLEYLPEGAGERNLSEETIAKTFRQLVEPATDEEIDAREREIVPAIDIPEIADTFRPSEVRYPGRIASILRGPEIYVNEDHASPLVQIGFLYPGGKYLEKSANAGITYLTLRSIISGGRGGTNVDFPRQMALYGGEVRPVVTEDYSGFEFSILSKNVEKGLSLLGTRIKSPQFNEDVIALQKALQIGSAQRHQEDAAGVSSRLLEQVFFREHPYAHDPMGTKESLGGLTAEMVQSWYQETIKNRKPLIFIYGDIKGTGLADYFVRNFSGTRVTEWKLPDTAVKALSRRETVDRQWDKTESVILIGFQAPPEGEEDSLEVSALRSYISGAGGWLSRELIEKQNVVADIDVTYLRGARAGMLLISAACLPGTEEKIITALETEIRRLQEPLPYKDFREVVNSAVGQYTVERQSRLRRIHAMATEVLADKDTEIFQDLTSRLKMIGQEDLQDVFRRTLSLDRSATVCLRGKEK